MSADYQTIYRGGLAPRKLRLVLDFVSSNLAGPVPLTVAADIAEVNPFHLARAFKQSTGSPFHRFVVNRRVEQARALLAETTLPISRVAEMVGFASHSHFTKVFRRTTGVMPSAYRSETAKK